MSALAKLQIARKEIGLHEDDYRSILERLTGQRSAKGLTDTQIGVVLDEFKKRHGWTPSVVKGGKSGAPKAKAKPADSAVAKKARALWISLWQLGAIRDSSESALEAFAKRQLKCDRLVWADQQQMYKLIEALKNMAERAGWSQDVAGIEPALVTYTLLMRLVDAQYEKLGRSMPFKVRRYDMTLLSVVAKDLSVLIWLAKEGKQ